MKHTRTHIIVITLTIAWFALPAWCIGAEIRHLQTLPTPTPKNQTHQTVCTTQTQLTTKHEQTLNETCTNPNNPTQTLHYQHTKKFVNGEWKNIVE